MLSPHGITTGAVAAVSESAGGASGVFSDPASVDDLTAAWGLDAGEAKAEESLRAAQDASSSSSSSSAAPVPKRSRRNASSPSAAAAAAAAAQECSEGAGALPSSGAQQQPSHYSLILPSGLDGTRALRGLQWVHLPEGALGGGPSARWAHACASVDGGRRVFFHGGLDAAGRVRGDTWCLEVEGEGSEKWTRKVEDAVEGGVGGGGSPRAWLAMVGVPERSLLVAIGRVEREAAGEAGASAGAAAPSTTPAATEVDMDVFDTSMDLWYPPVSNGKAPSRRAGHAAALVTQGILPGAGSAQRTPEPMIVMFGGLANRGVHEVRTMFCCPPSILAPPPPSPLSLSVCVLCFAPPPSLSLFFSHAPKHPPPSSSPSPRSTGLGE
jgi:hypothetical protein